MARKIVASPSVRPKENVTASVDCPFLYLRHGDMQLDRFEKSASAFLGFEKPLPEALRKEIRDACPIPLRGTAAILDNLMRISSPGDVYAHYVLRSYMTDEDESELHENYPEISDETAKDFANAVDGWALKIHELWPLTFFVGPTLVDGLDPWHIHSKERFTETLVPFLDAFLDRNPEIATGYSDENFTTLRRGDIKMLLWNFDSFHELKVPSNYKARIAELRASFG